MLLLQSLTCRLSWKQPWPRTALVSFLVCMCCCAMMFATQAVPCAAEALEHSTNHRFLLPDGLEKQGFKENLRLKLERLPGSHKDRYHTLRAAIHRDQARREELERQVLAGIEDKVAPSTSSLGSNGSVSNGGGPPKASLNVISGSSVGSGEYFASVSIGTPPQKLFLIADTGSDLTWVKCGAPRKPVFFPRKGKLSTNHSFDEGASSSFAPLSCLSSVRRGFSHPLVTASLGTANSPTLTQTSPSSQARSDLSQLLLVKASRRMWSWDVGGNSQGRIFDKAGGVLGLCQGPLSLTSQLTTQSAYANKFSYCLADFFGSSTIFGSLAFGETLLQESLKYTPLIQNPYAETFYYVGVQAVKVGGTTLDIPADVWEMDGQGNGGTIVDSGTTLAQFAKPAYDAIRDAFRQAIRETPIDDENSIAGLDLCYKTEPSSTSRRFPEFAIVFDGGLVLQPSQENYFTEAAPGITCLAMQEASPASFSVLGNLLQQNFHIEFDRLHNRLGVSPTDCSKFHS